MKLQHRVALVMLGLSMMCFDHPVAYVTGAVIVIFGVTKNG